MELTTEELINYSKENYNKELIINPEDNKIKFDLETFNWRKSPIEELWINRSFDRYLESINWTREQYVMWVFKLTDLPKCPVCGKIIDLDYNYDHGWSFKSYCCKECSLQNTSINKQFKIYSNNVIDKLKSNNLTYSDLKELFPKLTEYEYKYVLKNEDFEKIINSVKECKGLLEKGFTFNDIKAILINNLSELPKCPVCGKDIHSYNGIHFYNTCSKECGRDFGESSRVQTLIDTYGVSNSFYIPEVFEKRVATNRKILFKRRLSQLKDVIPLFTENDYIGSQLSSGYKRYKWKCSKCGLEFEDYICSWHNPTCPNCHPKSYGTSEDQLELFKFISEDLGFSDAILSDRSVISPQELDIYIPSKKIAIEYNGSYWHSDFKLDDPYYHLNKTNLCRDKGIKLVHIFSTEWYTKGDVIENRLRNLLGKGEVFYARKTEVKELDSKISFEFLESTHIQGGINCSVRLGLYYQDRLVAIMTFSKPRFNSNYEYELVRYSSIGRVIGGASKLLKYFEINYKPKSIITYADQKWSTGNLYDKLGFTLIDESGPNYFYVSDYTGELYSRYQCQKHKLPDILGDRFNKNLTETDNMLNAGFMKIFDCGNLVYSKTY